MKKSMLFVLIMMASTTLLLLGFTNAKGNGAQAEASNTTTTSVFIHLINETNGTTSIMADDIQWFEGEEANKQFREHEGDSEVQVAIDGYYIVNDSLDLQSLKIAANAQVFMQIYDRPNEQSKPDLVPNESISLTQFIALFDRKGGLDMRDYPFHLTMKHGEIVRIVQQFIS
ncbi:MAG: hypothetical protein WD469_07470 [Paenibacillaceae bacterium]